MKGKKMAKSMKQASLAKKVQKQDKAKKATETMDVEPNIGQIPKRNNLELIKAEPPEAQPVTIEIDRDIVIATVLENFNSRVIVTPMVTQDMVDSTRKVIELVASGHIWSESEELRTAFKKVPNSFANGPVLSAQFQLLCGKIIKFDKSIVPIYKTNVSIAGRAVYQDSMGFLRVTGRFPISKAEADIDDTGSVIADPVGTHSYYSYSPHNDIAFWCTEPQHQIHDQVASQLFKKSSSVKKDREDAASDGLEQKLMADVAKYEKIAATHTDERTRELALKKVAFFNEKLQELREPEPE